MRLSAATILASFALAAALPSLAPRTLKIGALELEPPLQCQSIKPQPGNPTVYADFEAERHCTLYKYVYALLMADITGCCIAQAPQLTVYLLGHLIA